MISHIGHNERFPLGWMFPLPSVCHFSCFFQEFLLSPLTPSFGEMELSLVTRGKFEAMFRVKVKGLPGLVNAWQGFRHLVTRVESGKGS